MDRLLVEWRLTGLPAGWRELPGDGVQCGERAFGGGQRLPQQGAVEARDGGGEHDQQVVAGARGAEAAAGGRPGSIPVCGDRRRASAAITSNLSTIDA